MLAVLLAPAARAQQLPAGDPLEDYLRVLQVGGQSVATSFTVRPLLSARALDSLPADSTHPWQGRVTAARSVARGALRAGLSDVAVHLFENTAIPWGTNDGAVWQGRGATVALSGGGFVRYGAVTLELRPVVLWNQNRAFTLAPVLEAGRSIYGNAWHPDTVAGDRGSVDLPQRFGPDAFGSFDWGQSGLRVDWRGATAGVTMRNEWWGPGIRTAILMSTNAPGFPHAFLGTARPVDVGIGSFEGQWIWGRLQQSDYFDTAATSTRRFVTGAVGSFSPKFFTGLSLGAARVFYEYVPAGGLAARDYALIFDGIWKSELMTPGNPNGDDLRDQILSLFGRWRVPGFETYFEWARNDHNLNTLDFRVEPEHSQAYTLGFQRVQPVSGGRLLRVNGELTHLEKSKTFALRPTPTYYAHHVVTQGYTQRGQVIGSGLGPGGDAQYLGADLFQRWGSVGLFVQRQVFDNDAAYNQFTTGRITTRTHDVGFTAGASVLVLGGPVMGGGSLAWTKEYDRYFVLKNDVVNLNLRVWARWRPW